MSSPLVLLVGGRLTSGKDAFADHLVVNHGFVKLGMSDTLAEALYRLDPVIPDWPLVGTSTRHSSIVDELGYVEAKKVSEVRRLLQVLGTEVGRELLGENIWVEAAKNRIQEQLDAGRDVVITGIRFPNEIELQNAWDTWREGGPDVTTVWVERPGLGNASQHASEGSVGREDFEYVLDNDGTLQELYEASDALLEVIRNDFE